MLFALFASSLSCGEFVLRRVCSAASLFCGEFVLRRVFRGEFVRGEFSASSCPASALAGAGVYTMLNIVSRILSGLTPHLNAVNGVTQCFHSHC